MATENAPSEVRTRILETAWRLIGERQDASVSLLEIAREAGVSRQTVYVNFGSRAGLLLAMVEHRDATSPELGRLKRSRPDQSTDEILETVVRNWFRYVPVVFKVAYALQAAATTDEDARHALDSRMQLLRDGLFALMRRLASEGRLAQGWSAETAADWCYHLVHLDTWQHLVIERGWKPADVVQRTVTTLRAVLIRPVGK